MMECLFKLVYLQSNIKSINSTYFHYCVNESNLISFNSTPQNMSYIVLTKEIITRLFYTRRFFTLAVFTQTD